MPFCFSELGASNEKWLLPASIKDLSEETVSPLAFSLVVGEGEIVKKGSLTDLRLEMPSGVAHPLEKAFE